MSCIACHAAIYFYSKVRSSFIILRRKSRRRRACMSDHNILNKYDQTVFHQPRTVNGPQIDRRNNEI